MSEAIHRYHTAKGYFQSCMMITRSPDRNDEPRKYLTLLSMMMLTGFSVELYLKAWMLQKKREEGIPDVEASELVRKYGHNIRRLFKDCSETGLDVLGVDELVDVLAQGHQDYTYRYMNEGDKIIVPGWVQAFQTLDRLDNVVDEMVGASASQGLVPGHVG